MENTYNSRLDTETHKARESPRNQLNIFFMPLLQNDMNISTLHKIKQDENKSIWVINCRIIVNE